MMTIIITFKHQEKGSNKMQKDKECSLKYVPKYMYYIDVSSFHISFLCKNDDDILKGGGRKLRQELSL